MGGNGMDTKPVWTWRFCVFGFACFAAVKALTGKCIDFAVYHRAAHRFWQAHPLYELSDGKMIFKYTPNSAWLFSPWAWPDSVEVGALLWNLTSVGLWVWAVAWMMSQQSPFGMHLTSGRLRRWLPVLATLTLSHALFLEFFLGQTDVLLLALLIGMVRFSSARPWLAGSLLALACLVKLPALLMLLWPLARRQWRVLLGFGLACMLSSLPVIGMYGIDGTFALWVDWKEHLFAATMRLAPWASSQSLSMVWLQVLFGIENITAMTLGMSQALGMAMVALVIGVLRPKPSIMLACLFLCVALLSPQAWRANYVMAYPAVLALWGRPRVCWVTLVAWLCMLVLFVMGTFGNEFFLMEAPKRAFYLARPFGWLYSFLFCLLAWLGRQRFCRLKEGETGRASMVAAEVS